MISVKEYFWCLLREQNDDDIKEFINSYIGLVKNKQLAQIIFNIDNDAFAKIYHFFELGDDYKIDDVKKRDWFMEKVREICYNRYIVNLEPYDFIEGANGKKIPVDKEGEIMDIEGIRDAESEDIILKGIFAIGNAEYGGDKMPQAENLGRLSRSSSFD